MDELSQSAREALRRYHVDAGLGPAGRSRVWRRVEGSLAHEDAARPRRGRVIALTVALSLAASVVFAVCGLRGELGGARHVDAGAARYEAVPATPTAEARVRGASEVAGPAASVAGPAPAAPEKVQVHAPVRAAAKRAAGVEELGLAAEVAYMRAARAAIDAGDGAAALQTLAAHAREFPDGQMLEDRLRLRIEALCALGRGEEARAEAAAFLHVHPNSTHAGRVRGLCSE